MQLSERNEDILDFIVRDFVRTASPVSSGRISEKHTSFGSSATVRNAMLELDEEGFLYQPHTSAGRAPTEKGYRYFVDNLLEIKEPIGGAKNRLDRVLDEIETQANETFAALSSEMSLALNLFAGVGLLDEKKFIGRGLSLVLREPEFTERNSASAFAEFAENMRDEFYNLPGSGPEPIFDIRDFGLVEIPVEGRDCGKIVVFSAGPRRMDYEKAASILKYAADKLR